MFKLNKSLTGDNKPSNIARHKLYVSGGVVPAPPLHLVLVDYTTSDTVGKR